MPRRLMRAYRKDTLDEDHEPSFLVDTDKDLFYCYGCDRGGDVIRFAELYHQVKFSEAKKTN